MVVLYNEELYGENCDYLLNNGIDEVNVVDLLFEKLNTNGAQMIILEAAAGFGKTCTTYEVLKNLVNLISTKYLY